MVDSYKEKLDSLIDSGQLTMWLEPSAPRTGSNFLSRLIYQSGDVDYVGSFTMGIKYDDEEAYARKLVEAYEGLSAQKNGQAVRLFLKEHAAFLGKKTWDFLKNRVKGTVFIVRDPLLQSMSEINSTVADPECIAMALKTKGEAIPDIMSYLEEHANKHGFVANNEKPAHKQLTSHVIKTGEYRLLDNLLGLCYGSTNGKIQDFDRNAYYRAANIFNVGADSYVRMAELAQDANPNNSIIINSTTIQGNPKIAHALCGKLGIKFDRKMVEGGWVTLNDTYSLSNVHTKRAAWASSAPDENAIVVPYKEAVTADALPEVSRQHVQEKMRAYLLLLNSGLCINPQTAEQFDRFFDTAINIKKAGVEIHGTLLEKNAVTCYAMVSASRTLGQNERETLKRKIVKACPKFVDVFAHIDQLCQTLKSQFIRNEPSNRLYIDGATQLSV